MFKRILLSTLLLSSFAFSGDIKIAVATNVSYAINDLKKTFSKMHPEIKVNVTLGSSGKLTAQIKNGAPYQLLMSADMRYPQALYKDKMALEKPVVYAQGGLALFSQKSRDFTQGLKLLKSRKISKIAVANPKTAPYGKAAFEAVENAGIYKAIQEKFVYAESISQTVSYALVATDIGMIAKSSLYSPKMKRFKKGIHWSGVNPKLYTPIKQGIVILKEGENNPDVEAFYNFVLGKKAQKILKDFGYTLP